MRTPFLALALIAPLAWWCPAAAADPPEYQDAILQAAQELDAQAAVRWEENETASSGHLPWKCQPGLNFRQLLLDSACDFAGQAWSDCKHFYGKDNLACLALGLAIAAPLANSQADQEFRDWYQDDVRSEESDRWSRWARRPGDHWLTIPIYLAASWGGELYSDTHVGCTLHTWGNRTLRAALVGAPTVGILQVALGAGRPSEGSSYWQPFQDNNGVAGHGFMGALPFLTAASMTDKLWLRLPLVAGSFATDWSRINDDGHYLSQAVLGWWIAYLSVKSVVETDRERNCLILPGCDGGTGMSVLIRY